MIAAVNVEYKKNATSYTGSCIRTCFRLTMFARPSIVCVHIHSDKKKLTITLNERRGNERLSHLVRNKNETERKKKRCHFAGNTSFIANLISSFSINFFETENDNATCTRLSISKRNVDISAHYGSACIQHIYLVYTTTGSKLLKTRLDDMNH